MRAILFSSLFIFLFSACAQTPEPTSSPMALQPKVQSVSQWGVLSKDIAGRVKLAMENHPDLSKESIYVQSSDKSSFGNAFRSMLTDELMNQGLLITSNEKNTIIIDWTVQKVQHEADRNNQLGLFQIIGKGLASIFVGGVDWGNSPPSEIIITFSATKDDTVLMRRSHVYYINGQDQDHYWTRPDFNGQEEEPLTPKTYELVNN